MSDHHRRDTHIAKLEKLLDVAGTVTPWDRIARSLRRVPVEVLIALTYRVERAIGEEARNVLRDEESRA